jgi:hypothetical protein
MVQLKINSPTKFLNSLPSFNENQDSYLRFLDLTVKSDPDLQL